MPAGAVYWPLCQVGRSWRSQLLAEATVLGTRSDVRPSPVDDRDWESADCREPAGSAGAAFSLWQQTEAMSAALAPQLSGIVQSRPAHHLAKN
jgi:hypothetical protein